MKQVFLFGIIFALGGITFVDAEEQLKNGVSSEGMSVAKVEPFKELPENALPIAKVILLETPESVPEIKEIVDLANEIIEKLNERKFQSMAPWFQEKVLLGDPLFCRKSEKFTSFLPNLVVTPVKENVDAFVVGAGGNGLYFDKDEKGCEVPLATGVLGKLLIDMKIKRGKVLQLRKLHFNRSGDSFFVVMKLENDKIQFQTLATRKGVSTPWVSWDSQGKVIENTTKKLSIHDCDPWAFMIHGEIILNSPVESKGENILKNN